MIKKINLCLILLSLFLILFYFFRLDFHGIKTNIFEIAVGLSFISTLVCLIKYKYKPHWWSLWMLVFVFAGAISVFLADDKVQAIGILKGWFIIPALLYFNLINDYYLVTLEKIGILFIPLITDLIVISLWAIFQHFGIISTTFYQVGDSSFVQYLAAGHIRAFGPFESPNYLAMFLAPTLFLSLIYFQFRSKIGHIIFLTIIFVLPVIAIIFSGSRGGLLAILILLILYGVMKFMARSKIKKNKFVIFSGSAILLYIIGEIVAIQGYLDSTRKEIYHYALVMLKGHTLFGIGLGNFQARADQLSMADRNYSFREFVLSYALHPHNLILAVWLNLGLLGIIAFMIIIFQFFKTNFLKIREFEGFRIPLVLAMSAILIHGLFDTTYFKNDLSVIFWLILAVSFLVNNSKQLRASD